MRTVFTTVISAVASVGFTVLAVSASAPAASETVGQTPRAIVRITDLDLTTPAGQRVVARRIDAAAGMVCADTSDRLDAAACRARAVANGMSALGRASLPQQVASR